MNQPNEIRKVLVVDDEADIRTVAEMSLSTIAGWATTVAASGDEAIEVAGRERFDVVLLDMMMPGRDGLSTLQQLRGLEGWAQIPVIMVTAKAQRHEIHGYLEAGAAGVITKPFDPMTLAQRVRELVASARRSAAPKPAGLAERLATLREGYVAKLPAKLVEIRETHARWIASPTVESYHAVRTPVHKLHGTAGSYGLAEVSTAAGKFEAQILEVGESGTPSADALEGALSELQRIVEAALED